MRQTLPLPLRLAGLLALATPAAAGPFTAAMTLSGTSLRVHPASLSVLGQAYHETFTNPDADEPNDELLLAGGTNNYDTLAIIDYPGSEALGAIRADFSIDIPFAGDLNVNGVTDFREVDRAIVGAISTGTLTADDGMTSGTGTIQATWNRAAGSASGTVDFKINLPDFGLSNLTFHHTFEIFEYRGTLTYEVTGTNVAASVNLPRIGGTGGFTGPFNMSQIDAGALFRQAATWSAPGGLVFQVLPTDGIQDVPFPITHVTKQFYGGILVFEDGDPTTPYPDEYDYLEIVIQDPNDSDGDGIPNLSDTAVVAPPAPSLGIRRDGSNVVVGVKGTAGSAWMVERSTTPAGPWVSPVTVTLSAAGTFELPAEAAGEGALMFRARTP